MSKLEDEIERIQAKGSRLEALCTELIAVLEKDYKEGKLSKREYDIRLPLAKKMLANARLMQMNDMPDLH